MHYYDNFLCAQYTPDYLYRGCTTIRQFATAAPWGYTPLLPGRLVKFVNIISLMLLNSWELRKFLFLFFLLLLFDRLIMPALSNPVIEAFKNWTFTHIFFLILGLCIVFVFVSKLACKLCDHLCCKKRTHVTVMCQCRNHGIPLTNIDRRNPPYTNGHLSLTPSARGGVPGPSPA